MDWFAIPMLSFFSLATIFVRSLPTTDYPKDRSDS